MNPPPTDYAPLMAHLNVQDGAKAIEFYKQAFGATELLRLTDTASGKIGHAELSLNGGMIMLASENPAWHNN